MEDGISTHEIQEMPPAGRTDNPSIIHKTQIELEGIVQHQINLRCRYRNILKYNSDIFKPQGCIQ